MSKLTIDFGDDEVVYQLLKGLKRRYRREFVSMLVYKTVEQYGTNAFGPKSIHGLIDIIRDSGITAPSYQMPTPAPVTAERAKKKRTGAKKKTEPVHERTAPVMETHHEDSSLQETAQVTNQIQQETAPMQEQTTQSTMSKAYIDYITGGFYDDPNQQL